MLRLDAVEIALDGFRLSADLTVAERRRIAVLGPSGAGKSTLLAAIAGFVATPGGHVLWQGAPLDHLPPGRRPISLLFQENNLFPHLSVARNVALGISPDLRLSAQQEEAVADALARVGLADHAQRKPSQLSGGQQGRAALARVLLRARPILLLDEPFSALGPQLKREMLDLVADVVDQTGSTMLMVTHDPEDARRICDGVIAIYDGRAHPPVATEDLLANPPAPLKAYLG